MKNQILWNKILQFDFDQPLAEYSFSVRLADENFWTVDFTKKAILEYKKFMYLAAVNDSMVSPSAIVDIVWHQHLIFTQSYQDFCSLLGKQVQHIPSTHQREDAQKFARAKERTNKLYQEEFGQQPAVIWEYDDMYASLQLPKAKYKLRSFVIVGLISMILGAVLFYFLLRPIYVHVNNPGFIWTYLAGSIVLMLSLEWYSRSYLDNVMRTFLNDSFIHQLHPYELMYLKNQNLDHVVHAAMNEVVLEEAVVFQDKLSLEIQHPERAKTPLQWQVIRAIEEQKTKYYHETFHRLMRKPMIKNFATCMNALSKYLNKSIVFHRLFRFNFIVLAIWFLLGFTRIMTGAMRDKPIALITLVTILFGVVAIVYLYHLTGKFTKNTIPKFYEQEKRKTVDSNEMWKWQYCYGDREVLSLLFLPAVIFIDRSRFSGSDSTVSSSCGGSGGSCGSSCSSCGGCGD